MSGWWDVGKRVAGAAALAVERVNADKTLLRGRRLDLEARPGDDAAVREAPRVAFGGAAVAVGAGVDGEGVGGGGGRSGGRGVGSRCGRRAEGTPGGCMCRWCLALPSISESGCCTCRARHIDPECLWIPSTGNHIVLHTRPMGLQLAPGPGP